MKQTDENVEHGSETYRNEDRSVYETDTKERRVGDGSEAGRG